jgi:hypothetical protein
MQHNMSDPSTEEIRAATAPTSIPHLSSHNSIREVFIWPTSSVIHKMQKMQGISSKLSSKQANIPNSVMYIAFSFISQTMENNVSRLQMFNILIPDGHNSEGKHYPQLLVWRNQIHCRSLGQMLQLLLWYCGETEVVLFAFFLMDSYMELKTVSVTQSQMLCCRSILLFIPFTKLRISYTS